jgi:hypothetical protein
MRNNIKKILKEDVYHLFEDGEFDPLGHAGGETESDDLDELGVDVTKDCVLGISKGNAKLEWPYLSLPAGYTCPFATMCKNFPAKWEGPVKGGKFKRPASWDKNIKPGPKAKFMCYAARAQGQYPGANIQAFKNLDLIKKFKTKEEISNLIIKSLQFHKLQDTDIFRIHEAGDFFSQVYFDAWIDVANKLPGTLFYAYTVSLPFWIARKGQIPNNLKLIASMDEENEQTIIDNGLRYSKVVSSVEEAAEQELPIDFDDSIAFGSDRNFALLIHGPQPSGSDAAQALKRNKDAGMYGKEGVLSTAKQRNQSTKDQMRSNIRKQLRNENFDFDWAQEIDPYKFVKDYYNSRSSSNEHKLSLMADDYIYLFVKKGNPLKVLKKMEAVELGDINLVLRSLKKYLKDHVSKIKRFISWMYFNKDDYEYRESLNTKTRDVAKMIKNRIGESFLVEDLEYWGVSDATEDEYEMGALTEIDDEWGSDNTELSGHKEHDGWVFIHRNLHKPPYWSIKKGRSGGKVIGYDTDIWLTDVSFKVQQKGKERVRREIRKNVHAGVIGKIKETGGDYNTNGWTLVTYNPYHHDSFVEYESGEPIYNASEAILKNTKEVWVR